jgi:long-chain acyl-CoA synthetase
MTDVATTTATTLAASTAAALGSGRGAEGSGRSKAPLGSGSAATTLPQLLLQRASANPKGVALRHHELGRWKQTTWAELLAQVQSIAFGLAKLGVGVGTRVALVGNNHPTMVASDLAALALGAVTIPIEAGLSPVTLTTLIRKTAAEFAVVGDQQQFDKIASDPQALDALATVVIADTRGMRDLEVAAWTGQKVARLALSQLVRAGIGSTLDFAATAASRRLEDPATVDVYALYGSPTETSVRTHAELVAAAMLHHPNVALHPGDELLAVLSMARPRERALTEVAWLQSGAVLNLGIGGEVEGLELQQVQPTVVQLDAQRLEAMRAGITQRLGTKGFRAKSVLKTLAKHSNVARPAGRDTRIFRGLGVLSLAACLLLTNTFRSLHGLARVGLCVAILALAAFVAMASGVAVRPFVRKAYGLNRARQLVAFDALGESAITMFSGLHLAPTRTNNPRATPLAGTDLDSLSGAVSGSGSGSLTTPSTQSSSK